MEQNVTIHRSRKKAVIVIIAGVLLAAVASIFFLYLNDAVFGWMFVIFAVLVLILGVSSYFDRDPQVILTETGITELHTTQQEIEWSAILHADDFWYRGQDFVRLLVPADYKAGLLNRGWFWRLDRMYAQNGFRAIYIRVSGLDVSSATLLELIKSKLPHENTDR